MTMTTTDCYPIRGFDWATTDEDKILAAAAAQLERACSRDGVVFDQPSRRESQVVVDRVILRNSRGELARYRGESNADGRFRLIRLVPRSS